MSGRIPVNMNFSIDINDQLWSGKISCSLQIFSFSIFSKLYQSVEMLSPYRAQPFLTSSIIILTLRGCFPFIQGFPIPTGTKIEINEETSPNRSNFQDIGKIETQIDMALDLLKDLKVEWKGLRLKKDTLKYIDHKEANFRITDVKERIPLVPLERDLIEKRTTEFEVNLSPFFVGLVLTLLSNLFAFMVRLYKRSLQEYRLNMVTLINYYGVEFINFIVCLQNLAVMFASVVCHLPLPLARALHFLLDFAGFQAVGFVILVAVIRLLFVIKFTRMVELNQEATTKKLSVCMGIFYLIVTMAFLPHQLSSGYISPFDAYLSGTTATITMNRYSIAHCVHMLIALITALTVYFYIQYYLRTQHSMAIVSAESGHADSIVSFRTMVSASVVCTIMVVLLVILQKTEQHFPLGVVLSSTILIGITYNFARRDSIQSYFNFKLKQFYLVHFIWSQQTSFLKNIIRRTAVSEPSVFYIRSQNAVGQA